MSPKTLAPTIAVLRSDVPACPVSAIVLISAYGGNENPCANQSPLAPATSSSSLAWAASDPCVISSIELARSQGLGKGQGRKFGPREVEV